MKTETIILRDKNKRNTLPRHGKYFSRRGVRTTHTGIRQECQSINGVVLGVSKTRIVRIRASHSVATVHRRWSHQRGHSFGGGTTPNGHSLQLNIRPQRIVTQFSTKPSVQFGLGPNRDIGTQNPRKTKRDSFERLQRSKMGILEHIVPIPTHSFDTPLYLFGIKAVTGTDTGEVVAQSLGSENAALHIINGNITARHIGNFWQLLQHKEKRPISTTKWTARSRGDDETHLQNLGKSQLFRHHKQNKINS